LVVDIQATQSPAHAERGIAGQVRQVATELVRRGSAARLVTNPDLPAPIGFPQQILDAGRPVTQDDDFLTGLDGPLAWLCPSPFESCAAGRRILPPTVLEAGLPIITTLYDLIPLSDPDHYLGDPNDRRGYQVRCELLRWADLVPCASVYTRTEATLHLGLDARRMPVTGCGVADSFHPGRADDGWNALHAALPAVKRSFVLTVGGPDPRKNLDGLVQAWALVRPAVRRQSQLVVICRLDAAHRAALGAQAAAAGLEPDEIVWAGQVDDDVLVAAYRACSLFVFASRLEGFGLPVAEAGACGAPAICSNTAALPEILDWPEACFDPSSVDDMAAAIEHGLGDTTFRRRLVERAGDRRQLFTSATTVDRLLSAVERMVPRATVRSFAGRPQQSPSGTPALFVPD
jgi:glycosyltransferase involved in cell wall biosynthesis